MGFAVLEGMEDFEIGLDFDFDVEGGFGLEVSRTRFPGFFWPAMGACVREGGRKEGG